MRNYLWLKTLRQRVACVTVLLMLYLGILVMRHHDEPEHTHNIPVSALLVSAPNVTAATTSVSTFAPVYPPMTSTGQRIHLYTDV